MYETQFGLTKRPFRALATGGDVFVGPQTAAAMARLKKALATPDAIVSVSGPVGVGKSTNVRRALEAIGDNQVIVTVGRMQLGHDEVLELLLEELGADMPTGTVQRFTAFRRLLLKHAEEGTRVFIVVEDATRVGADALCELEALTACDAGVSEGANVVLMGDSGIDTTLQTPQLARLRQRMRLRQQIMPLGASELAGYFKHCFRLAGNDFDAVFEDGSAEVLHRLSGGIPRVANNLVESSLISAVENKLDRVNVAQIKLVANEEYGLQINAGMMESEAPPASDVAEPLAQPQPEPAPAPKEELTLEQALEPQAELAAATPPPAAEQKDDVPELIQDTLPNLEVLAPELAMPETADPEPRTEPTPDLQGAQVESAEEAVPDWEKDPTLAQLRPDLDALEHAMAVAQGIEAEEEQEKAKPAEDAEPVPEITLDREIQAKVDEATEILKEEEARRAEREAQEKEESGIDDRPISEILADARAKKAEKTSKPDNSVEAQFESASLMSKPEENTLAAPPATDDELHVTTDTISDLPILQDMTTPSFEPAAHRQPQEPAPQDIPELAVEPEAEVAEQPVQEPVLEMEPEPVLEMEPEPAPMAEAESEPAPIPELKLEDEPLPEPQPEPDPEEQRKARKADAELEQIAANLARARTIDDCDDKMAETLFGEEFSMMAAEVAANAPPELSANDDESDDEAVAEPEFDGAAAIAIELETKPNGVGHIDTSASQRLATVRALNSGAPDPDPEPMASALAPATPPPVEQPQSIEDQINTSMTQTLEALSVRTPGEIVNDDGDDEPKRGFFSRFKRS
jgi:type II secretory pathway predicted ATPase ExeA